MSLDPSLAIARKSYPDQAEQHLRQMILDGSLQPGERLNEVSIAESIGISRGPLREAIKRLSGQGYLTMEAHRGAFVKSYEPQEIIDLYELRSALELYALRLTIERASDESLDAFATRLAEEHDRYRRHEAEGTSAEPYAAELDFHEQLVSLCGNDAIKKQLADANRQLFLALRPTSRTEVRRSHVAESHIQILEHVRARDTAAGVELLSVHLLDSMSNSLSVLGLKRPGSFGGENTQ